MTSPVVLFRGWPGLADWEKPKPGRPERLGEHNALYLFAAGDAAASDDRLGLAAALYAAGPSVVSAALVVPDDLSTRDPPALTAIEAWATDRPVSGRPGAPVWQVLTSAQFFDPLALVGDGRFTFTTHGYGGGFVIGPDLGRFFGLVAEHAAPARAKRWAGGWSVYLPGWGAQRDDGSWYRASPNRPEIRLKARRVGWQLGWGPCGTDEDGRRHGRRRPARFIDLGSLAYALDGDRGASADEHRANLGLAPAELPARVGLDVAGAEKVARSVEGCHELALALDETAGRWFTTPNDRSDGVGRIDLARVSSPGAVAAEIPRRFRVTAPLAKFKLSEAEHWRWAEALHGGWVSADPRLVGRPVRVVAADVSSCFPLVAHHLGWWELLCADSIRHRRVTYAVRRLAKAAATDPRAALDPASWQALGCTLVEVRPDEPFPVEIEDEHRPDGRLEIVPVRSPERSLWVPWLDVIAVAVRSRRVPHIVSAVRLEPVGREPPLRRRLPVLPGLVIELDEDPAARLVRARRELKARGEKVLAAELRVAVNSLVFGNFSRFDPIPRRRGRAWVLDERPGPWCFLPLAASVTAGSRLLLAVLDRLVSDLGGVVSYRDTDSSLIVSSPAGGTITLADGSALHELSWAEADDVLATFDPLSPEPGWPVWKSARGTAEAPLCSLVYGPKRHMEFTADAGGAFELVERTEANLGGVYVDPPAMAGRAEDGGRVWSRHAAEREVARALDGTWDQVAWDSDGEPPFPSLRRLAVVSAEVAESLPAALGAAPGSRYLEGTRAMSSAQGGSVVALDPGGSLDDWQTLRWLDRRTGARVFVSTDDRDIDAVQLVALDQRAGAWSWPSAQCLITEVEIDPLLVRHVGRVSGVLDAYEVGLPGTLDRQRPRYGDGPERQLLTERVAAGSLAAFARDAGTTSRTAKRIAAGEALRPSTLRRVVAQLQASATSGRRCALPECGNPVTGQQRYCSAAHRERAAKRRKRSRSTVRGAP